MQLNRVILAGNVCADAEVRQGEKENFATFSLAVNQGKDKGVDFVPCVAFGKVGEIAGKYLTKGKPIFVEGRFSSRKVKDKTYYGIIVFNIQFLSSADNEGKTNDSNRSKTKNDDDSNPFK